jgi:putative ABC transport system substrate-binding protein
MMHRCRFLLTALAGVLAASLGAGAQKDARVGFLVMARNPGVESAFPRGLAELGYLEGRDVTIEWRSADGRVDQLQVLASELVGSGVDVIVAGGPEARIAAMKAAPTVPIVVVGGSDAVAEGWAASLARPGGNVTGLTVTYPEILGKQLALLTELMPGLSRVAVIRDPDAISPQVHLTQRGVIQTAARSLRVSIDFIEVRRPSDLDAAFRRAVQDRRQAVIVNETAMIFAHRAEIAELAPSPAAVVPTRRSVVGSGATVISKAFSGALETTSAGEDPNAKCASLGPLRRIACWAEREDIDLL